MWLKKIRISEGLTQTKAGELSRVSQQLFSAIENGERDPHQKTAKRIAEALHFEKYGLDWTKFYEEDETSGIGKREGPRRKLSRARSRNESGVRKTKK